MINAASPHMPETSALGRVLSIESDIDEKEAHTPVLPVLRRQQSDLRHRLRTGFDSRRDILFWSHAAAAVSAGRVPDRWFSDLINDRWTVAALLKDEKKRKALTPHAPSEIEAQSVRDDIQQDILSPAFQRALAYLRPRGKDYIDSESGATHLDKQRHLGMRPRLHQLAVSQHKALHQALATGQNQPIATRREALEWVDYAGYSCSGILPREFTARVSSPLSEWWTALTSDQGVVLESLLAQELMPHMNRALRIAAAEADEKASLPTPHSGGGSLS